jgi:hypothetical protein
MALVNGDYVLQSAAVAPGFGVIYDDKHPAIHNDDSESLLLGWENTVMRGEPWYSRPGQV